MKTKFCFLLIVVTIGAMVIGFGRAQALAEDYGQDPSGRFIPAVPAVEAPDQAEDAPWPYTNPETGEPTPYIDPETGDVHYPPGWQWTIEPDPDPIYYYVPEPEPELDVPPINQIISPDDDSFIIQVPDPETGLDPQDEWPYTNPETGEPTPYIDPETGDVHYPPGWQWTIEPDPDPIYYYVPEPDTDVDTSVPSRELLRPRLPGDE